MNIRTQVPIPPISEADRELLARPEGDELEKLALADPKAVARVACSFLNARGGRIWVGVSDAGRLVGIPDAAHAIEAIEREVYTSIKPLASCAVTSFQVDEQVVVLVEVAQGADGPYASHRIIYVREGEQTREAAPADVRQLVERLADLPRWESRPNADCRPGDFDAQELGQAAVQITERRFMDLMRDSDTLLDRLYLSRNGLPTNAAVVLFALDPARFFPQTRIRAVHFADDTREHLLDNQTLSGHLFAVLAACEQFLRQNLPVRATLPDGREFTRTDRPAYPPKALREALLNALIHRDYTRFDSLVSVYVFPDRLEIWNPGSLLDGVTINDIREGGVSQTRNPEIAQVLLLRGQIERLGIGGRRIVRECREAGLPEPEWQQVRGGIQLTFRSASRDATGTPSETRLDPARLTDRIRDFLQKQAPGTRFVARDYSEHVQSKVSERQIRHDLKQMLQAMLIERKSQGQKIYYVRTDSGL